MYRLSSFKRLLKKSKKIFIFCHLNADPDAICSAYALQYLIKKLVKKSIIKIVVPDGMNVLAKKVAEFISIKSTNDPLKTEVDLIIAVDTNNLMQLGKYYELLKKLKTPIVVVDHHTPHPDMTLKTSCLIWNENTSSTCEIIYEIFKQLKINPSKKVANAILMGIVYDTRHFILASSKSIINVAELIRFGACLEDAISIMEIPISRSELIARLKATQRLVFFYSGDWIIAITKVNSYQASVSRIITLMGAHVAIVGGTIKERFIISLRCKRDFHNNTRIHLGKDIAIPVGEIINGSGGGHALAAGINGVGNLDDAIDKCVDRINAMIP